MNRKRLILIVLILLIFAIIFLLFDPSTNSFFPKCPLLMATGWECPGCGSQRAVYDLMHFDVKAAFYHNPLVVIFLPYIILGLSVDSYAHKNEKLLYLRNNIYSTHAIYFILVVIISFFVLRNVL